MLPRCEACRKEMTRDEKREHMERCEHPECVALLALYNRVSLYVRENIDRPFSRRTGKPRRTPTEELDR